MTDTDKKTSVDLARTPEVLKWAAEGKFNEPPEEMKELERVETTPIVEVVRRIISSLRINARIFDERAKECREQAQNFEEQLAKLKGGVK